MEPEIARRCKSCGAAIRARSAFCPQCGVAVPQGDTSATPVSAPATMPESPPLQTTDSKPSAETVAPLAQTETSVQMSAPINQPEAVPEVVGSQDVVAPSAPIENPPRANAVAPDAAAGDAVSGKRQRVTPAAAREVMDDGGRHRAEKLRRASNVVLDEAATDPSLRFVLVAAVLIIISLLLLVLARVL